MNVKRSLIFAALGVVLAGASVGVAHADPAMDQYTIVNAPIICTLLTQTPTVAGVEAVISALQKKGLSAEQAGEVVARSAVGWCPDQLPELKAFVAKYSGKQAV